MIPSIEECYEFMARYEMLDHIRVHSIVVEKIATLIGRKLKEAGVDISLERIPVSQSR